MVVLVVLLVVLVVVLEPLLLSFAFDCPCLRYQCGGLCSIFLNVLVMIVVVVVVIVADVLVMTAMI